MHGERFAGVIALVFGLAGLLASRADTGSSQETAAGPDPPADERSAEQAEILLCDGRLTSARDAAREALASAERTFGKESPAIARPVERLARVLVVQAEFSEADALYRRALALRERDAIPQKVEVARILSALADIARQRGDRAAARELATRALAMLEEARGRDDPELAGPLGVLRQVSTTKKDLASARALAERCLLLRERSTPEDPLGTLDALIGLASVLELQEDPAGARKLHERALALRREVLGGGRRQVAAIRRYMLAHGAFQPPYLPGLILPRQATSRAHSALGREQLDVPASLKPLGSDPEPIQMGVFAKEMDRLLVAGQYRLAAWLGASVQARRGISVAEDPLLAATELDRMARCLASVGELSAAAALCRQALVSRELGLGLDHPDVAASLATEATIRLAMGDSWRGRATAQRAVAVALATGPNATEVDQLGQVRALIVLSQFPSASRPQISEAYESAKKAVKIATAIIAQGPSRSDDIFVELVACWTAQVRYWDSLKRADAARAASDSGLKAGEPLLAKYGVPGPPDVAPAGPARGRHAPPDLLLLMGRLHRFTSMTLTYGGDWIPARQAGERALALTQMVQGEAAVEVAECRWNLARILYWSGLDRPRARVLIAQAIETFRRAYGDGHAILFTMLVDAGWFADEADLASKEESLRRAVAYAEELWRRDPSWKNVMYSYALQVLSEVQAKAGGWHRARSSLQKLIDAHTRMYPDDAAHRFKFLVSFLDESLAHGDAPGARALLPDYFRTAERLKGVPVIPLSGGQVGMVRSLASSGDAASARRMTELAMGQAAAFVRDVLPGLSDHERLRQLETMRPLRDTYVSLHDRGEEVTATYQVLLSTKGLGWRLLVASQNASRLSTDARAGRLLGDLDACQRELARVALAGPSDGTATDSTRRIEELTSRKEMLQRDIARISHGRALRTTPPSYEQLVAALPPGHALVDYLNYVPAVSKTGGAWLAFVTLPGSRAPVRLELGKVPNRKLISWRQLLAGRAPRRVLTALGRELSQQLWDPVAAVLGSCRRVVVCPDHGLWGVPLGALPSATPGTHLAEEFTFTYVTTAADLVAGAWSGPPGKGLACIGDLDYGSMSASASQTKPELRFYLPLPATREEVVAIARQFHVSHTPGAPPPTILSGRDASKTAVRASVEGRRFVHIATHGSWDGDAESSLQGEDQTVLKRSPMLSVRLALSGANLGKEGLLSGEEAMGLPMSSVEVAVLSACESGLGAMSFGEGLLGIKRALLAAGAGKVVSSAWKVDDEATRSLMTRFYAHLWTGQLSCEEALTAAQRDLIAAERQGQSRVGVRGWGAFTVTVGRW